MAALADMDIPDPSTTPAGDRIWQLRTPPPFYEDKEKKVVPHFVPDPTEPVFDDTPATTLWREFASLHLSNVLPDQGHPRHRQDSVNTAPPSYHDAQAIYELEARELELPYVHANSLIGSSDNTDATEIYTSYQTPQTLVDSAVSLPIIRSSEYQEMVGLNELVIDHDIMTPFNAQLAADVPLPLSLPITPLPTPPSHSIGDIAAILPINCVTEAEYENSDAHYQSEQSLFVQSPLSLAQSTAPARDNFDFSSINIADFLKLGHAKQCWCGHCIDKTYDAPRDEAKSSVASLNRLSEENRMDEGDYDYGLSMLIHPSESEPDTELDGGELFDDISKETYPKQPYVDNMDAQEDDGWLLFTPLMPRPAQEHLHPAPPLYLPSSPILHRQGQQQRASTPTVVVTLPNTLVDESSDDYIAVAAPVNVAVDPTAAKTSWTDMFPRRPSSAWKTGLANYEKAANCGLANAMEGSWRWGRETEEEWWDWAVEEEC